MAVSRFSQSPSLRVAAGIFGSLYVAFGANAILRPQKALEAFGFDSPASATDAKLIDSLTVLCGARDIALGLGIFAATYFADRKTLGWMLIVGSGVAVVDGAVCKAQGAGEWSHWGPAPLLTALGSVLLGLLDGGA